MEKLFVVRFYDGFDNEWMDVTAPIPYAEADAVWKEKTNNGTKSFKYSDIDYYKIYPADTRMIYSSDRF